MSQTKLTDEAGRLASLRRYEVLDTPAEAPFDKITQLVKTVLDVPIVAVSLIDADRQWFKSSIGLGLPETPRHSSFCTHTIRARQPMVINDAARDPKFATNPLVLGPPFIASYAGAPLVAPDGYVLGSLCAIDTVPRQFDDRQIDVLTSSAALVVDEFELRRLARTDSQTGAHSRRTLLAEAERAMAQFSRHDVQSAIVSFDIDDFSQFNETYGRAAGDEVLRAIAARITEGSRPGDTLARLGGDEFALLLSWADREQAMRAAERSREAIAGLILPQEPQLHVTASFGVAALDAGCTTAEKWLAQADEAREDARAAGGNTIIMHAGTGADDDACIVLRRDDQTAAQTELPDDGAGEASDEAVSEDADEDIELYKNSIEPLSRDRWLKLQRLRHVQAVKTGRLAYGGIQPGMVNCQILQLEEDGMHIETYAQLSPMPEYFSLEFADIYCRARMRDAEGYKIDLEFIFEEV